MEKIRFVLDIDKFDFILLMTALIFLVIGVWVYGVYDQNPSMLQALATIALVIVTLVYAYRLSRESYEKIEKRKMVIRKGIFGELESNLRIVKSEFDQIKKDEEIIKDKASIMYPRKFIERNVYDSVIHDLGILTKSEIKMIIYIYGKLKEFENLYNMMAEIKRDTFKLQIQVRKQLHISNYDVPFYLKRLKEKTPPAIKLYEKIIEIYIKFFDDEDEKKLEKKLASLFK